MNKLLTKIVGVALGTTMAVGVGVGVAVNSDRKDIDSQVHADNTATFAPSNFTGQGTSGTGSPISATVDGVTFACDKGYGTTQVRCYKDSTITISSSNTITQIEFSWNGSYTGGLNASYSGLSTNSWTEELSSQLRMTSCTVTYESGSSASYTATELAISGTISGTYNTSTNAFDNSGFTVTKTLVNDDDPSDTKEETVTSGITFNWEYSDGTEIELPISTADTYSVKVWAEVEGLDFSTKDNDDAEKQYVTGNLVVAKAPATASHTLVSSETSTFNILNANDEVVAVGRFTGTGGTATQWNSSSNEMRFYVNHYLRINPAKNYELISAKVVFNINANKDNVKPTPKYHVGSKDSTTGFDTTATSNQYYDVNDEEFALLASGSAGNIGVKSVSVVYTESEDIATLTSVSVTGSLLKPTQYVGQPFDSYGLSFEANYDDDTSEEIQGSDIVWDALEAGKQPKGTYNGVEVNVTGATIINREFAEEIIFLNSLKTDSSAAFSILDTAAFTSNYISLSNDVNLVNAANSTIKTGSSNKIGSFDINISRPNSYIDKVTIIASSGAGDNTEVTISGSSSASETKQLTDNFATYVFDISSDKGTSFSYTTNGQNSSGNGKRSYIHSITVSLVDTTATAFARKVLDDLTCNASGTTAPSTSQWSALKTFFNGSGNVSEAGKVVLKQTEAPYETWKDYVVTESSTDEQVICAALVKYDFVVQKYLINQGLEAYEDFLGRFDEGGANANYGNINIKNAVTNNTPVVTTVIIISVISLSTLCGYFLLRKRKEQ